VVCNTANDGMAGELDQVTQIEHVIGSKYNDVLSGGSDPLAPELVIEGRLGDDNITGGAANDELWGDDGNDTVTGGAGDDVVHGDAGDDILDGGDGDGDICLWDSTDQTKTVNCEPNN
jgi:Ca2+-binding RTX toxin-like protein